MKEGEPRFEEELPVEEVKKSLDNKEPSLEKELQPEGEQEKIDTMDSPAFQKRAIKFIERLPEKQKEECIGGLDSDEAWKIREGLLKKGEEGEEKVVISLAGIDSERAWKTREKLDKKVSSRAMALSLAGIDSERAWKTREEIKKRWQTIKDAFGENSIDYAEGLSYSLSGIDSDEAWKMREDLIKGGLPEYIVVRGLDGIDSDRAWSMREKLLSANESNADVILQSLAGLDSDRAWSMRDKFKDSYYYISSLAGLDSERAWKIREKHFVKNRFYFDDGTFLDGSSKPADMRSIEGLDSDRAWSMREEVLKNDERLAESYKRDGRGDILYDVTFGIYGGFALAGVRKARHDRIERQKTK